MKFRVFHKELNKYLETENLYINNNFAIVVAFGQFDYYIDNHYQIGKDVEIEWGFEYEGEKYFENDIVDLGALQIDEDQMICKYGYITRNEFGFAIVDYFENYELISDFDPIPDIIGNYRLNPELMEGLC